MAAPAIGTPALLFTAGTIISFYRVSGRISLPASDFLPCHVVPGRRAGPVPAAVLGSSGAGKGMPGRRSLASSRTRSRSSCKCSDKNRAPR